MDLATVVVNRVAAASYPEEPPFPPDRRYAEYEFEATSKKPNPVYEGVRDCFAAAGLDADRFGDPEWNPLADLIAPGETVILKPNMIKETHPRDPEGWRWVLTHGSVVRAVADYVFKAVGKDGHVIIADAPQTDSSFSVMVHLLGFDRIAELYRSHGFRFDLVDLRREEWVNRGDVIVERRDLRGDPAGDVAFDLGQASEFASRRGGAFYGADYDARVVNYHHSDGRHEYLVSGSVINADVVFSLPKLKTHKKAGITVSLKNLVGVTADKNWLPHHTEGYPGTGGDEHPHPNLAHRLERRAVALLRRMSLRMPKLGTWLHRRARTAGAQVFGDTDHVIRSGNWYGNDTVWRMCLDLNKLVLYGNPDGTLRPAEPANRRRHFALVDGIIGGEGRGPENPDPAASGLLIFGLHPASVDATAAVLMGFDPELIPIVRGSFHCKAYPIAEWDWPDIRLRSNNSDWHGKVLREIPIDSTLGFEPHFGWKGHIERMVEPDHP